MIDENSIKEAFAKVKNDIFSLGNELYSARVDISELKNQINALNELIVNMKIELLAQKTPTHIPTQVQERPADSAIPSNNPTVPQETRGLKYPNLDTSTGNGGVPTDRQTHQQTDNSLLKQRIQEAEDILDSLDGIKKEIRLKFKTITNQEMMVFSTIYELESDFPEGVEYRQIALKLHLSESSIRDYVQKLISKGIPVDKIKLNNKKILLKISSKLKNLAPLDTLIKLRDI